MWFGALLGSKWLNSSLRHEVCSSGATGRRKRERAEVAAHVCSKRSTQTHWGTPRCKSLSCQVFWLFHRQFKRNDIISVPHIRLSLCPCRLTSLSCDPPPWSRCQTSSWQKSWSSRKWSPCCTTTVCTTRPIMQPVSCSAAKTEAPPPRPTTPRI